MDCSQTQRCYLTTTDTWQWGHCNKWGTSYTSVAASPSLPAWWIMSAHSSRVQKVERVKQILQYIEFSLTNQMALRWFMLIFIHDIGHNSCTWMPPRIDNSSSTLTGIPLVHRWHVIGISRETWWSAKFSTPSPPTSHCFTVSACNRLGREGLALITGWADKG